MYEVDVSVKRGGVTGEPLATVKGLGHTIADAVKDAMTAKPAKKIRGGDFLIVKVAGRW
jgi:hypothetical protein